MWSGAPDQSDRCFGVTVGFVRIPVPQQSMVGAGQHLGLGLVGGHLLVDGGLQRGHAADADPLPQVVVAALGACRAMVDGLPAEPAAARGRAGGSTTQQDGWASSPNPLSHPQLPPLKHRHGYDRLSLNFESVGVRRVEQVPTHQRQAGRDGKTVHLNTRRPMMTRAA
ncbi:hypothetical protein EYF80_029522 [Liparis tanakae]|uniref:Uncharacterized protein n=1 Tax=Liparis tanakae TaxID=230148 RepID=A0A4Z2H3E0_9TELE|nr:hypothetical protein EYF80_029522 [Liparis tanakae]